MMRVCAYISCTSSVRWKHVQLGTYPNPEPSFPRVWSRHSRASGNPEIFMIEVDSRFPPASAGVTGNDRRRGVDSGICGACPRLKRGNDGSSIHATIGSTSVNLIIQVSPCRVTLLNQLDLPCSIPFLDRLFSQDGAFHGFVNLVPNQPVNTITFRESFHQTILVLPEPLNKIRCDTDIQSAVGSARKDVDTRGFHIDNLWIPAFAGMTGGAEWSGFRHSRQWRDSDSCKSRISWMWTPVAGQADAVLRFL